MKLYVANPIYDSVFKYLLEDERIAKTLLSALLKKEVMDVKVRRHEYTNTSRENISMFRIDFGATVREDDGSQHLILIELQKTWVETETLRFRQYVASQYNNKENIIKDSTGQYAIPMITVYLLGHRVGDIEEPILYVKHNSYDYDGNEVTKGIPDPFVESLVHDSIIVQIPLLHGQVNNRLEKVLSVFNQSNVHESDKQVIEVDEDNYVGDEDMQYILRRLQSAASDPNMRQTMNVEDEYFSAIEDRDTAIMLRDNQIKLRDDQIKQRDNQIKQRDDQIKQRDNQIKQRENQLKEKDAQLEEQDLMLRSIIKGALQTGMTVEAIAQMTGRSVEEINDRIQ